MKGSTLSASGCFRNLLLVIRLQLLFPKALALCGLTRVGETKFGFNQLLLKCLPQSDQQLMTEAPETGATVKLMQNFLKQYKQWRPAFNDYSDSVSQ
jgi:hypothetical protein